MHCENIFCVYWRDKMCLLDEISLDCQGLCKSCIYVDIEEELLSEKRENELKRLMQLE